MPNIENVTVEAEVPCDICCKPLYPETPGEPVVWNPRYFPEELREGRLHVLTCPSCAMLLVELHKLGKGNAPAIQIAERAWDSTSRARA